MDEMTIATVTEVPFSDGDNTALVATDPAAASETDAAEQETVSQTNETAMPAALTEPEEDVYLPVYNGEVRPLKASERKEITTLLQLGLKQRDFLPQYERLKALAAESGAASVKAYIETLCDKQEERFRQEAVERYGEVAGERVYELESAARRASHMSDEHEPPAVTFAEKTAMEFAALQREYPEYTRFEEVPLPVLKLAAENGIALLDAQNRYVFSELKRQARQAEANEAATVGSTGSLADRGEAQISSVMEAFRAGLHRRM